MSVTPTYPGVYIREIPSGNRTIIGVATSITAFVGPASRGPVNEPVRIHGFADFERTFGGLSRSSDLGHAVRDFYLNGGGEAIIVRIARLIPSAANGPGTPGTGAGGSSRSGSSNGTPPEVLATSAQWELSAGDGTLSLEANGPGTWANSLRLHIQHPAVADANDVAAAQGVQPSDLFTIVVDDGEAEEVETHRNVTVVDGPRRVDRVLLAASRLLRAMDGKPLPAKRPGATDPKSPAGPTKPGEDGDPPTSNDYLGDEADKTGIYALLKADLFNLLCILPPHGRDLYDDVWVPAATLCLKRRAFLIIDPPSDRTKDTILAWTTGLSLAGAARNAAVFFPRILRPDPLRPGPDLPGQPCGAIAGTFARTDATRGVWKAPAGIDAGLAGVGGLTVPLTDGENGVLNPVAVNCLRTFRDPGTVIWGSRTRRGADALADDYKYIPVRRLALFLEETLYRSSQWVVFEPNDEPLWSQIRLSIGAFMQDLFRRGAFQGSTPREAYFVQCGKDTTTQYDIDRGIVNIVVGFAPLKPAEFVIVSIQQKAATPA